MMMMVRQDSTMQDSMMYTSYMVREKKWNIFIFIVIIIIIIIGNADGGVEDDELEPEFIEEILGTQPMTSAAGQKLQQRQQRHGMVTRRNIQTKKNLSISVANLNHIEKFSKNLRSREIKERNWPLNSSYLKTHTLPIENGEEQNCTICLSPMKKIGFKFTQLCNNKHMAHKSCSLKWLKLKMQCPTCKRFLNM
jgi:hypothetical protein